MRTEGPSARVLRGALVLGFYLAAVPVPAAEAPVPEILEPAARVDVQPGLMDEDAAETGWPLDETIFTDVEAFTVPAVPIALPEDQAEE
ncbi:MAG: hypothetical protein AAGG11_01285 [Pseudomonadota bacterium]